MDLTSEDDSVAGVLTIGGVDTSRFKGDISFAETIEGSGLWLIPLDDCYASDTALGFADKLLLIDSGTTLILLPPDDAEDVHVALADPAGATIRTDGTNYILPCNTTTTLYISINGIKWPLSPDNYLGNAYDDAGELCVTNIQGRTVNGTTTWILGAAFMKTVYVVFDRDNNWVGLAARGSGGVDFYNDASAAEVATTTTAAIGVLPSSTVVSTTISSESTSTSTPTSVLSISVALSHTTPSASETISVTRFDSKTSSDVETISSSTTQYNNDTGHSLTKYFSSTLASSSSVALYGSSADGTGSQSVSSGLSSSKSERGTTSTFFSFATSTASSKTSSSSASVASSSSSTSAASAASIYGFESVVSFIAVIVLLI